MRRILLMLVLASLLAACQRGGTIAELETIGAPADPAEVAAIDGSYVVNGVDPLGTEYSGHLTIVPEAQTDTYTFQWIVVGSIQEGVGQVEGNQVNVTWHTIDAMEATGGTTVYTVTEYGVLDGIRSVEGYANDGTEVAYPNQ